MQSRKSKLGDRSPTCLVAVNVNEVDRTTIGQLLRISHGPRGDVIWHLSRCHVNKRSHLSDRRSALSAPRPLTAALLRNWHACIAPMSFLPPSRRWCFHRLIVCLFFVNWITQKLVDRFAQNSVKRWHMGQGSNDQILAVIIRVTLGYVEGYGSNRWL